VKNLSNILKTNVAACSSVGYPFLAQIGRIYMDMLALYKIVSEMIATAVITQGPIATKTPLIRGMRTIKKEILKLMETFVSKSENDKMVLDSFIPPLFDAVLGDYKKSIDLARDAEVLSATASIITKLKELLLDMIPPILDAVFEPTLSMISKDLSEFPEHRVAFFKLIGAINEFCFPALLRLPPAQFKLIVDSVVWAFKHTMRDIGETGLQICYELLVCPLCSLVPPSPPPLNIFPGTVGTHPILLKAKPPAPEPVLSDLLHLPDAGSLCGPD